MTPAQIEAAVDANAAALGIPVTAAQRPGVLMYFGLAARMADLVNAAPLTTADESGNVWRPVEPELGE